jgi:hypothetical protein
VIPFYYGSGPVPLRQEVTVPVPQHWAASRVTHVLILILHFSVYLEERREHPEVVPPPSTDKKEPPSPDKKPRNKADIQSDQSGTEGLVFFYSLTLA